MPFDVIHAPAAGVVAAPAFDAGVEDSRRELFRENMAAAQLAQQQQAQQAQLAAQAQYHAQNLAQQRYLAGAQAQQDQANHFQALQRMLLGGRLDQQNQQRLFDQQTSLAKMNDAAQIYRDNNQQRLKDAADATERQRMQQGLTNFLGLKVSDPEHDTFLAHRQQQLEQFEYSPGQQRELDAINSQRQAVMQNVTKYGMDKSQAQSILNDLNFQERGILPTTPKKPPEMIQRKDESGQIWIWDKDSGWKMGGKEKNNLPPSKQPQVAADIFNTAYRSALSAKDAEGNSIHDENSATIAGFRAIRAADAAYHGTTEEEFVKSLESGSPIQRGGVGGGQNTDATPGAVPGQPATAVEQGNTPPVPPPPVSPQKAQAAQAIEDLRERAHEFPVAEANEADKARGVAYTKGGVPFFADPDQGHTGMTKGALFSVPGVVEPDGKPTLFRSIGKAEFERRQDPERISRDILKQIPDKTAEMRSVQSQIRHPGVAKSIAEKKDEIAAVFDKYGVTDMKAFAKLSPEAQQRLQYEALRQSGALDVLGGTHASKPGWSMVDVDGQKFTIESAPATMFKRTSQSHANSPEELQRKLKSGIIREGDVIAIRDGNGVRDVRVVAAG